MTWTRRRGTRWSVSANKARPQHQISVGAPFGVECCTAATADSGLNGFSATRHRTRSTWSAARRRNASHSRLAASLALVVVSHVMAPTFAVAYHQTLRSARNAPAFRLGIFTQTSDAGVAGVGRGRCNAVCAELLASSRGHDRWVFALAHPMCPPALRRIVCADPRSVLDDDIYASIAADVVAADLAQPQHARRRPAMTVGDVFAGNISGISGWATRTAAGLAATRRSIVQRARSTHTPTRVGLFAQDWPRSAAPMRSLVPPAILGRLAGDHSTEVRTAAADAAGMPDRVLAQLAVDPYSRVRSIVAANPDTPSDALGRFAVDPHISVRCAAAFNSATQAAALRRLASDESDAVRANVALNSATQAAALRRLASDESDAVRSAVMLNPVVPLRTAWRLLKDPYASALLATDRPKRRVMSKLARNVSRRSLRRLRRRFGTTRRA